MIRIAIVAVVCAIVLPAAAFTAFTTPFTALPFPQEVLIWTGKTIDFPVAAFNWLLPEALKTHMTWSLQCGHTYCFPRDLHIERTHYQLVGAAAYLVLFAAGGMVGAAIKQ